MAKRAAQKTFSKAKNAIIAKAFIVGVVIAVLIGLFGQSQAVVEYQSALLTVLVVAGLIVGFFNVGKEETMQYLLAAVSLVIVSNFGGQVLGSVAGIGPYLVNVFNALILASCVGYGVIFARRIVTFGL